MSRFFELPGTLADDLWTAVTSQPPALTDAVALAVRKALETSTAAPPVQHTPPPWGAPAPVTAPVVTWPQYVKVKNGTTIAAMAPLNPEYISSQTSWIFGHMPGTFVSDPSAGHRSPAGLPLTASGKVMMGEATFDNDAQALAWAAVNDPNAPPSAQAQADWQAVWARMARPTAPEAAAIDHPSPANPAPGPAIEEGTGNAP